PNSPTCQLWWVVADRESVRYRDPTERFPRPARWQAGWPVRDWAWRAGLCVMNIVIAAGGTGGHLYPAVALAREFLRQEPRTTILFVGTSRELERKVLTHEGFELEKILAWPVMGLGMLRAAAALLALPVGLCQSLRILR